MMNLSRERYLGRETSMRTTLGSLLVLIMISMCLTLLIVSAALSQAQPEETAQFEAPMPDSVRMIPVQRQEGKITDSASFVDQCIDVAEQIDPAWAERLRQTCGDEPELLEQALQRYGGRISALVELREVDPTLYELKLQEIRNEMQVTRVTNDMRVAVQEYGGDSKPVGALNSQLRGLVYMQVVLSHKVRELYLQRLREHVEELEASIADDQANFGAVVEQQYQDLLAGAGLGEAERVAAPDDSEAQ